MSFRFPNTGEATDHSSIDRHDPPTLHSPGGRRGSKAHIGLMNAFEGSTASILVAGLTGASVLDLTGVVLPSNPTLVQDFGTLFVSSESARRRRSADVPPATIDQNPSARRGSVRRRSVFENLPDNGPSPGGSPENDLTAQTAPQPAPLASGESPALSPSQRGSSPVVHLTESLRMSDPKDPAAWPVGPRSAFSPPSPNIPVLRSMPTTTPREVPTVKASGRQKVPPLRKKSRSTSRVLPDMRSGGMSNKNDHLPPISGTPAALRGVRRARLALAMSSNTTLSSTETGQLSDFHQRAVDAAAPGATAVAVDEILRFYALDRLLDLTRISAANPTVDSTSAAQSGKLVVDLQGFREGALRTENADSQVAVTALGTGMAVLQFVVAAVCLAILLVRFDGAGWASSSYF